MQRCPDSVLTESDSAIAEDNSFYHLVDRLLKGVNSKLREKTTF